MKECEFIWSDNCVCVCVCHSYMEKGAVLEHAETRLVEVEKLYAVAQQQVCATLS